MKTVRAKKFLFAVFALFISAALFAGGQRAAPAPEGGSDHLEITWFGFSQQGFLPKDGSIIQKEFEKKYNITIKNIPVDHYNNEQVNLMLATGVSFDIKTHGSGGQGLEKFAESGLVRPIPDGYIEQYAPEIAKVLNSAYSGWKKISSVDGKLYTVPTYGITGQFGLALRADWLKNLGVTSLPKTLDELEALLVRFRNEDPDRNGQKDTYALGSWNGQNVASVAPYIFASYGVAPGRWNVASDGTPQHWAIMDEYRQGLARLRSWYVKEIYHPEIITDTRITTTEKFMAGKIAGTFGTDWMLGTGTGTTPFGAYQNAHPELSENEIRTMIPPVSGPKGALTVLYGNPLLSNETFYFGKNVSDEKMKRLLAMFNDTLADRKQYAMMWYGIEGQHFDFDADGFVVQRPGWNTPEAYTELGWARYFFDHNFIPDYYLDLVFPPWRFGVLKTLLTYDHVPIHQAAIFQTGAEREFGTAVDTITNEYFLKVLAGEWDINSTWNSYVSRFLAAGGQRIIDAKKDIAKEMGLNN
jgi:putative aldouronate transport system substrate-binding protein